MWSPVGFSFTSVGGITFWLESRARGSWDHFPPPALSYLLPLSREKKRGYSEGELTCLSDSLLCSRIIFLQLTAFWLCDIFTKSDLAADLNAKWTLQPWTTFLSVFVSSPLWPKGREDLTSPPHPAWPHRPCLTVALATERWAGRVGGGTTPVTNMRDHQSGNWYPGVANPPVYIERRAITK